MHYQKTLKNLDTFVQKFEHEEISTKITKATEKTDKNEAIKDLCDIFKVINATDKTMLDNLSKIKGITEKEIQNAINELGLKTALRSANEKITPETDIYIADTIGELGLWYTLSPLVFIGGSLIPHGGQNFMEPSRFRDAVVVGPHMHNFTDAMNRAKKADAIIQIPDTEKLEETVQHLLTDKDLLDAKRSLAYNWATGEAKVLDGIVDKVKGFL